MDHSFHGIFALFLRSKNCFNRRIAKSLGGVVRGEKIICTWGTVDTTRNQDADLRKAYRASEDSFLYFPWYLDLEFSCELTEEDRVKHFADLLSAIWQLRIRAIAVSDLEHLLPARGGYITQHQWGRLAHARKPRP